MIANAIVSSSGANTYGGEITVASQVGQGSDFLGMLPARHSATTPSQPEKLVAKQQVAPVPVRIPPVAPASDDQRPQVLLIEDNRDVIAYIQRILENDYAIDTARNRRDRASAN